MFYTSFLLIYLVEYSKALDALKCAHHYLECARRYLRTSAVAREFIDTYMVQMVSILLRQESTSLDEGENECVYNILLCICRIVKDDLTATEEEDTEHDLKTFKVLVDSIFDETSRYYTTLREKESNAATRLHLIHFFQRIGGFTQLATILDSRAINFLGVEKFEMLLAQMHDMISEPIPCCEDEDTQTGSELMIDDAKAVAEAFKMHMLRLDDTAFKEKKFIRHKLFQLYLKLSESDPMIMQDFFESWRRMAMQLIQSKHSDSKASGWDEITEIITQTEKLFLSPLAYIVSGAGCIHINGRYDLNPWVTTKNGHMKQDGELSYYKQIPNDSDPEWAGKTLTLFRCTMRSQQKWWFISNADEEQPGTDKDIDYYQHKSKQNENKLPSLSGWLTCREGVDPPPTLLPINLKDCDTFEHQMVEWAIQHGVIELALDEPPNSKITRAFKDLISFASARTTEKRVIEYLSRQLSKRVGTSKFPHMQMTSILLEVTLESIRSNQYSSLAKEDIWNILSAVIGHILGLDEMCTNLHNMRCICLHLVEIYRNLSSFNNNTFLGLWRQIALKLIQNNRFESIGWEHMDMIIDDINNLCAPPSAYIISGAGSDFINGRYDIGSTISDCVEPVMYQRTIPADEQGGDHADETFCLYVMTGNKRWYLSEVHNHQPGTCKDKDYYQHADSEGQLPPLSGWSACRRGLSPEPTLEPIHLNVISDETKGDLAHELVRWIIEQGVIEIACDAASSTLEKIMKLFKQTNGFAHLAAYLSETETCDTCDQFPSFDTVKILIEKIPRPASSSSNEEQLRVAKCNTQSIVNAVMKHVMSMDDESLEKIDSKSFGMMCSQLLLLSDWDYSVTSALFDYWRSLALKLVTSKSLKLRLFGWNEIDNLIRESENRRPLPKVIIISDGGTSFINGTYNIDPNRMSDNPIKYTRTVPVDDLDANENDEGRTLCLTFRQISSSSSWWFLSDSDNDIDYYKHKSIRQVNNLFPSRGWITCEGEAPAPTIKAVIQVDEEFNSLENKLAMWVLENGVVELALGDSAHSEVVPKSKELMKFLAGYHDRDYHTIISKQLRLKPSHLLLAQHTFSATQDIMVLTQLYLLLVSINPSMSEGLQGFANPITKTAMMLRIQKNDPTLLEIQIGYNFTPNMSSNGGVGVFTPSEDIDFVQLGEHIARNTYVESVQFDSTFTTENVSRSDSFFEGLKSNSSIETLSLDGCNVSERTWIRVFHAFKDRNCSLREISLLNCGLENGHVHVITPTLRHCAGLTELKLSGAQINNEILTELVSAIVGHEALVTLGLSDNLIGRSGCKLLSSLLKDPQCHLTTLQLNSNQLDDNCLSTIANALARNTRLESLGLCDNDAITEDGLEAFVSVLCNTSSVKDTYLSNHTLKDIEYEVEEYIEDLDDYLELNRSSDKSKVAMQKILDHHYDFEMDTFFAFDLKVLPVVVAWFKKAKEDTSHDIASRLLSSIYQFTRALPMMFLPLFPTSYHKSLLPPLMSGEYDVQIPGKALLLSI